ncbi:MAG: peptidoglycan-binding protein, partial [Flavobacterium sp.]
MKKLLLVALLFSLACCKKHKPDAAPLAKPKEMKFKKQVRGFLIDSSDLAANKDSMLVDFYRLNGFETVWNEVEIRKALISVLAKSGDEEGLNPKDYSVARLQAFEKNIQLLTPERKIDYDILLTKAMRRYIRHLWRGKLNPNAIYRTWDIKRTAFNTNTLLSGGISGDSISSVIEMARPKSIIYKRLLSALQIINSYPEQKNFTKLDTLLKIKRGDTAVAVRDIKRKLIFWKDLAPQDSVSIIFDRKTSQAVRRFQQRHGLVPDGVIATGTIKQLNYSRDDRKAQILANLERWRWFAHDFGKDYVIINIPEYLLSVVKEGDTLEQKRIVVGRSVRKSAVLSSTFSNIILNPTWTVPPTIIERDLTPKASQNRGYFAAENISIYRNGKPVSASEWIPSKAKSYRYVQKPGDHNSLGNVKFNFPSRFMVYLHDTNHRDLFVMHSRSYSSGCIRLENPLTLAEYMLNDSIRWPMDSIKKVVDTKKTTSIA